jgi:hypothetical protein
MAYDEHWSTGTAGPIASLPWFAKVLRQRQRDVPARKMIVHAEEMTFDEVVLTAKESEGNIRLDLVALNPTFDYADDDDRIHHVWLLDAVTAFDQWVVARSVQPRGYALWRLGGEDPSLWRVFGQRGPLDAAQAAQPRDIRFACGLGLRGAWRNPAHHRPAAFRSPRHRIRPETQADHRHALHDVAIALCDYPAGWPGAQGGPDLRRWPRSPIHASDS